MTVGWGIVGLGRSANTLLAPGITADPNSRLVAVVSRDEERAADFARRHGATWSGISYDDLLSNPEVDIVLITTPNALHSEQVVAAARAGKHVVCDKPLGINAIEAALAVAVCSHARVQLGIVFESRQIPCFQIAREVIRSGGIGDVVAIQIDASAGDRALISWRADPVLAGLGTVFNVGVHTFDILRYMLDSEVVEVSAMFETGQRPELERLAMVLMRFACGALVYANTNELTPFPLNDFVVHGAKGRIDGRGISRPGGSGEMRVLTPTGESIERSDSAECWRLTVAGFSKALIAGAEFSPSGIDGLRSAELTDAIAVSARQNVTVHLGT